MVNQDECDIDFVRATCERLISKIQSIEYKCVEKPDTDFTSSSFIDYQYGGFSIYVYENGNIELDFSCGLFEKLNQSIILSLGIKRGSSSIDIVLLSIGDDYEPEKTDMFDRYKPMFSEILDTFSKAEDKLTLDLSGITVL